MFLIKNLLAQQKHDKLNNVLSSASSSSSKNSVHLAEPQKLTLEKSHLQSQSQEKYQHYSTSYQSELEKSLKNASICSSCTQHHHHRSSIQSPKNQCSPFHPSTILRTYLQEKKCLCASPCYQEPCFSFGLDQNVKGSIKTSAYEEFRSEFGSASNNKTTIRDSGGSHPSRFCTSKKSSSDNNNSYNARSSVSGSELDFFLSNKSIPNNCDGLTKSSTFQRGSLASKFFPSSSSSSSSTSSSSSSSCSSSSSPGSFSTSSPPILTAQFFSSKWTENEPGEIRGPSFPKLFSCSESGFFLDKASGSAYKYNGGAIDALESQGTKWLRTSKWYHPKVSVSSEVCSTLCHVVLVTLPTILFENPLQLANLAKFNATHTTHHFSKKCDLNTPCRSSSSASKCSGSLEQSSSQGKKGKDPGSGPECCFNCTCSNSILESPSKLKTNANFVTSSLSWTRYLQKTLNGTNNNNENRPSNVNLANIAANSKSHVGTSDENGGTKNSSFSKESSSSETQSKGPSKGHSFGDFIFGILKKTGLSSIALLLALHYIHRLRIYHPVSIPTQGCEYRVFSVALILANKYLDDKTFTNKTWAGLTGMTIKEINIMEREFLSILEFKLEISEIEFVSWIKTIEKIIQRGYSFVLDRD